MLGQFGGDMAYVYQEFPKWKYHPKFGAKIVQNADEEKTLGKGWVNNPNQFPKPSRIAIVLDENVKPWWTKWKWGFVTLTTILGLIAAILNLRRH